MYREGYLKGMEARFLADVAEDATGRESARALAALAVNDRVTWGVGRSGVVQAVEGEDLVILDDGWAATPPGQDPRCVATPPFVFRLRRDKLGDLKKAETLTPEMQPRHTAAVERKQVCTHPAEELYDSAYDDGYQVFCRICNKHVRLGRLRAGEGSAGNKTFGIGGQS